MDLLPIDAPTAADWLRSLPPEGMVLLYKHSPVCPASSVAVREVQFFVEGPLAVPVHVVDVVRQRRLARELAAELGVRHESPQAILLVGARAAWDASHGEVTASAIEAAVRRLRAGS